MNETSHVHVGDVMTTSLRMIKRSATVAQAIEAIREAGVSSLVVERRDETDEFGLVAITDIAREVTSKDRPAERVNVYEVMTKPVLSLPLDMRTEYAVRLLVRFKLSRALVVNHARTPVGIVTLRDMVLRHHSDTKRTSTK
jgi:signal-transduction protein with cAMP-binding, CBS, and nucleotidyltransferase domain